MNTTHLLKCYYLNRSTSVKCQESRWSQMLMNKKKKKHSVKHQYSNCSTWVNHEDSSGAKMFQMSRKSIRQVQALPTRLHPTWKLELLCDLRQLCRRKIVYLCGVGLTCKSVFGFCNVMVNQGLRNKIRKVFVCAW